MCPDMISHSAMPSACMFRMMVGMSVGSRGWQVVETEGLDAEHHAVDRRHRWAQLSRHRQRQRCADHESAQVSSAEGRLFHLPCAGVWICEARSISRVRVYHLLKKTE